VSGDRCARGFSRSGACWRISVWVKIADLRCFDFSPARKNAGSCPPSAGTLALDVDRLKRVFLELSGATAKGACRARPRRGCAIILLDDPTRASDVAAKRDFLSIDGARSPDRGGSSSGTRRRIWSSWNATAFSSSP